MAYTEVQLRAKIVALEDALARGERSVQFADRSVTYKSDSDIRSAIAYFTDLLNQLLGGRRRQSFGVSSKGF